MKKTLEFIAKANQVIIFLLGLVGLFAAAYTIIPQFTRQRYRTEVPVVQSTKDKQQVTISNVKWLGKVFDESFIGIVQKSVLHDRTSGALMLKSSGGSSDSDYESQGEMVNVVISNGSNQLRKLLPRDGLILFHNIAFDYPELKLRASIFRCVTEDTNGDHILDKNDRSDLYIVPADSSKQQFVVTNAIAQYVISDSKVVVKTRLNEEIQFYEVDVDTQGTREIRWK